MSERSLLLDTGPLVAFLDRSDSNHEQAKLVFSRSSLPFRTCESVISEVCFLMKKVNPGSLADVLSFVARNIVEISFSLAKEHKAIQRLFEKYQDQPISLADACLIRMAEVHHQPRIVTFDSDFEIYRWGGKKKFEIVK